MFSQFVDVNVVVSFHLGFVSVCVCERASRVKNALSITSQRFHGRMLPASHLYTAADRSVLLFFTPSPLPPPMCE